MNQTRVNHLKRLPAQLALSAVTIGIATMSAHTFAADSGVSPSFEIENKADFEIENKADFEIENKADFEIEFEIEREADFEIENKADFEIETRADFEIEKKK